MQDILWVYWGKIWISTNSVDYKSQILISLPGITRVLRGSSSSSFAMRGNWIKKSVQKGVDDLSPYVVCVAWGYAVQSSLLLYAAWNHCSRVALPDVPKWWFGFEKMSVKVLLTVEAGAFLLQS